MKDKIQAFITILVAGAWVYLVIIGKASIEGFVVIAVYVIKKALDLIEVNNGGGQK